MYKLCEIFVCKFLMEIQWGMFSCENHLFNNMEFSILFQFHRILLVEFLMENFLLKLSSIHPLE